MGLQEQAHATAARLKLASCGHLERGKPALHTFHTPTPQGTKTEAVKSVSLISLLYFIMWQVCPFLLFSKPTTMKEQTFNIILRHTDGGKWLAFSQGEQYKGQYHDSAIEAIVQAILRKGVKQ